MRSRRTIGSAVLIALTCTALLVVAGLFVTNSLQPEDTLFLFYVPIALPAFWLSYRAISLAAVRCWVLDSAALAAPAGAVLPVGVCIALLVLGEMSKRNGSLHTVSHWATYALCLLPGGGIGGWWLFARPHGRPFGES